MEEGREEVGVAVKEGQADPGCTPLVPLLPVTGMLRPRNHRRVGPLGGGGFRCWTWRGLGAPEGGASAPNRVSNGRVQMHHPCEPPFPGRGCAGWNRPASEQPDGVRPAEWGGGGGWVGGRKWRSDEGRMPKWPWRRACHGWVQLHHHPCELPCQGWGCGAWKRPASWRPAGKGRRRGRGGKAADWRRRKRGWRRREKGSEVAEEGSIVRSRTIGQCVRRIGEAQNPGPSGGVGEEERDEASAVDEAWARVREESGWVPAWRTWSRQVVRRGGQDGSIVIDLVPPSVMEEEEDRDWKDHQEWGEEELEEFLQRCELEAGLIQEMDLNEVGGRAEEWRRMEEEATMAGIPCPRVEEQSRGRVAETAQDLRAVAEIWRPPPPGQQRRVSGKPEGGKKKRQRWRPLKFQEESGEPLIEETRVVPSESVRAVEPVPVHRRPARTPEVRPRGRRQRGAQAEEFEVEVVTFNGSGSPQAVAALEVLRGQSKKVAAVLLQEHLARGDAVADLQHAAKGRGFKLAPNEAAEGKGGGPSAGVAIAVPLHRGWGGIQGPCWDLSPPGSPGRLVGAWVQAGPRGGMACLTLYLWTSEGMSQRNVALVEAALAVASTCGCAWLMGADWNVTPKALREAVGRMLDRVGAVIRAPAEATCYPPTGQPKVLDYFLVDSRIADAVGEAQLAREVVGSPHRAVKITVKGKEVGGLVQMVRKPKMLPRDRPTGCPRRPLVPGGGGDWVGEGGARECG